MYSQQKIFRVVDVNFNRCKEGLRVVEDIFRFIIEDDDLRKQLRKMRHSLDKMVNQKGFIDKLIASRDSGNDLGKNIDLLEVKRKNVAQIFYVNLQRVKESLRVLEEFLKLINIEKVKVIKKLRYQIYELEQNALQKWSALRNFR